MAMTTTMTLAEVIGLSIGWFVAIVAVVFHILIWKFTHAWTYLKAWLRKSPIIRTTDGGIEEIYAGRAHDELTIDLPGNRGFIIKSPHSHVFDRKSKVPVYQRYGDYAFSIDPEYSPIIGELKEMGFNVTNYDDLKDLIRLATDVQFQAEMLADREGEEKKLIQEHIDSLRKVLIRIQPYKTYKVRDLSTMFPNNINAINNEHKIMASVDRNSKKQRLDAKILVYAAVAAMGIGFAAVLISKFVKDPSCPEVVCSCGQAGLGVVKTAVQNPDAAAQAAKSVLMP